MKSILAASAALLLSTAAVIAEETKMQPGDPSTGSAEKSTNSDGTRGANEQAPGTAINQTKNSGANSSDAGKSTNSDGSSGATGESSGEGTGGSQADDGSSAK